MLYLFQMIFLNEGGGERKLDKRENLLIVLTYKNRNFICEMGATKFDFVDKENCWEYFVWDLKKKKKMEFIK